MVSRKAFLLRAMGVKTGPSHSNSTTPPSLPLFTNAVNVKDPTLHFNKRTYLRYFTFPNLTTFELSATSSIAPEPGYYDDKRRDKTRRENKRRGTNGEVGRGVRVELAAYLLDDFVEEAAGELGLDLLLDPPVRGEVRDVGFVSGA